jgi:hypothetical protein
MNDNTLIASNIPAEAVSQFGESLAQASESHRALVQEMTLFAKDESLRFVNLRLERNGTVLEKLQTCTGLPGLIGVQQEWLRDFVQDYASQNMRLAGALQGLTQNAITSAAEAASDTIDRVRREAGHMAHEADKTAQHAGEQAEQMTQHASEQVSQTVQNGENYYQEPLH